MAVGTQTGGQRLDDPARLEALARTGLMDSGPEEAFDRLTRLAARLLGAPQAFLTLLDDRRQYFKSRQGVADDVEPLPAARSYCQYVVHDAEPFVVEDLRRETRIADPSGLLDNGLLAYCGVPLTDADGNTLGTLCAMDNAPRRWSADDVELLRELAAGAVAEIALRLANRDLRASVEQNRMLATLVQQSSDAIYAKDRDGVVLEWNRAAERLYGYIRSEAVGRPVRSLIVPPERDAEEAEAMARALQGNCTQVDSVRRRRDGELVHVSVAQSPIHDAGGEVVAVAVIARDIEQRIRHEERLRHLADHDPLTGLFNRRRFEQELARAVSLAGRYGTASTLLLIDLDGFKRVNDTLGHACGDEILTRVAATLRSSLRETDVIGRLGGDEFAVIASSAGAAEAEVIAEKVLAAIREHGIVTSGAARAHVSASIGVMLLDQSNRLTGEALLAGADAAMYRAKQRGRDRIAWGEGDADADDAETSSAPAAQAGGR